MCWPMTEDLGAPDSSASFTTSGSISNTGITDEERASALRAGTTPVPRKFVQWVIVGFAVLGIGGFIADKVVGNGSAGSPAALAENTGGNNGVPTGAPATTFNPTSPAAVPGPSIKTSMNAYLSLKSLNDVTAPAFRLDQLSGKPWSLDNGRGRTIVIAFLNAECNDSCTVITREIADANADLGSKANSVTYVVVNTDPLETSVAPPPPIITNTSLRSMTNVIYLTGTTSTLAKVWSNYGVTVVVQPSTRTVTHNDIMYFVNSKGQLSYRVTPFANEGVNGVFSLGNTDITRFGRGIASVVSKTEGSS